MMNLVEALKNIDIEKFAKEFEEEQRQKREKREAFWASSLCQNMIDDMKRINQGFDAEHFSYFPEEVKSKFGWEKINTDDIRLFIDVMASSTIGVNEESDLETETDEDCMFDNYSFVKKGIVVSIMIGQGSSVYLSPE